MFEAKNISAELGGRKILDGVSLEIEPGAVTALLGANGAGKSTLLKAMCGDIKLADGEILVERRRLNEWDHCRLARKRAVLTQHTNLNFPFSAREVALLGRNPHVRGTESAKDLEIVDQALRAVEAAHLAHQSFPTLSGGEQQRVHLARILAQIWESAENECRYLLLDEPTSSLDPAHQHLTMRIARRFARENTGVLVVLHDLNLAAAYADKICLMKNGRIYRQGAAAETLTAPNIKATFDFDASVIRHEGTLLVVPQMAKNAEPAFSAGRV